MVCRHYSTTRTTPANKPKMSSRPPSRDPVMAPPCRHPGPRARSSNGVTLLSSRPPSRDPVTDAQCKIPIRRTAAYPAVRRIGMTGIYAGMTVTFTGTTTIARKSAGCRSVPGYHQKFQKSPGQRDHCRTHHPHPSRNVATGGRPS